MNLTISADEDVIRRARAAARRQGRSLNDVLRETLERLAGARSREAVADEFLALTETKRGTLEGSFRREDAYDARRNG
ncbi:MAG: MerR family transcriptional regulator [Deltaproteobacteria bacterium]|nr:MerR family transcriptional regulator [Deltaproteobacteria bacterium]